MSNSPHSKGLFQHKNQRGPSLGQRITFLLEVVLHSTQPSPKNSQIYLDARVMYIVNALQSIKRDPTANTVPAKNSELALNMASKETGPEFYACEKHGKVM
jgi:hypothetical protein